MKRRHAIKSVGAFTGGAFLLPGFLSGCNPGPYTYPLFQWGDTEIINAVGEIILPETEESPGASAAGVGDFVQKMITDVSDPVTQQHFLLGYSEFKMRLEKKYGKHFTDLNESQQADWIELLEKESNDYRKTRQEGTPDHFYHIMKDLILLGYFTSEPGATKALEYVPVPGEQKGVIPYSGQKAYAL